MTSSASRLRVSFAAPENSGTVQLVFMHPVICTNQPAKKIRLGNQTFNQHCAGGKIEKNEMGGACGAYGRGERCAQGSGGET